jgi:hypothetical protein
MLKVFTAAALGAAVGSDVGAETGINSAAPDQIGT